MSAPGGGARDILVIRAVGLHWGIAADAVLDILPHRRAIRAPGSAPFVEGLIRYGDGLLPVVDLSARFRLPAAARRAQRAGAGEPAARQTLVVPVSGGCAGLTVDAVIGSRQVDPRRLVPPPERTSSAAVQACLADPEGDVLLVLDPRAILETDAPLDLPLVPGAPARPEAAARVSEPGADTVLVVRAAGYTWGMLGRDIREVLPHGRATPAPNTPPFVEGLIRYRDGVLPVVDLSARFRMPDPARAAPAPNADAARGRHVLVVPVSGGEAGLAVDEVVGLRPVDERRLVPLPRMARSSLVHGCLTSPGGGLLVILHPRAILETDAPLDLPLPPGWIEPAAGGAGAGRAAAASDARPPHAGEAVPARSPASTTEQPPAPPATPAEATPPRAPAPPETTGTGARAEPWAPGAAAPGDRTAPPGRHPAPEAQAPSPRSARPEHPASPERAFEARRTAPPPAPTARREPEAAGRPAPGTPPLGPAPAPGLEPHSSAPPGAPRGAPDLAPGKPGDATARPAPVPPQPPAGTARPSPASAPSAPVDEPRGAARPRAAAGRAAASDARPPHAGEAAPARSPASTTEQPPAPPGRHPAPEAQAPSPRSARPEHPASPERAFEARRTAPPPAPTARREPEAAGRPAPGTPPLGPAPAPGLEPRDARPVGRLEAGRPYRPAPPAGRAGRNGDPAAAYATARGKRRRPLVIAALLLFLVAAGWLAAGRRGEPPTRVAATNPPAATAPPAAGSSRQAAGGGRGAAPVETRGAPVPSRPSDRLPHAPAEPGPAGKPTASPLVVVLEETPVDGAGAPGGSGPAEPVRAGDVTGPAGAPRIVEYTVVRGDTLWAIARRFTRNAFRYKEIASENRVANPDLIFPGQLLILRIHQAPPALDPARRRP